MMSDLLGQVLYTNPVHVVYAGDAPGRKKEMAKKKYAIKGTTDILIINVLEVTE